MRVDLKVPYSQKEAAKKAGARWDPARQVWYVEDMADLRPLLQWMPPHLLKAHKSK